MKKEGLDRKFLNKADLLLSNAISCSTHPFHLCTVATTDGMDVEQRTVVLRKWDLKRQALMFHTDYRSSKVAALKKNNKCSVLFYSKEDKLQLRFQCVAHIHYKDKLSDDFFAKATDQQKECYRYSLSPSSVINTETKEKMLRNDESVKKVNPYENFSLCIVNFTELDLLHLEFSGHTRVHYSWDSKGDVLAKYIVA
ncbi:hypothetical protein DID78_03515 [Candidatus Marinamargulisbacteria bacterium SCGC AG-343-D04]|nr:hypothetical protein DID78_03515 [Candidatus Marinamargulisbacteria bacterium SCGC AG-343-D04]